MRTPSKMYSRQQILKIKQRIRKPRTLIILSHCSTRLKSSRSKTSLSTTLRAIQSSSAVSPPKWGSKEPIVYLVPKNLRKIKTWTSVIFVGMPIVPIAVRRPDTSIMKVISRLRGSRLPTHSHKVIRQREVGLPLWKRRNTEAKYVTCAVVNSTLTTCCVSPSSWLRLKMLHLNTRKSNLTPWCTELNRIKLNLTLIWTCRGNRKSQLCLRLNS